MEQQSTLRLIAAAGIGLVIVAVIVVIRLFEFNAALSPDAWKTASDKQIAADAAALGAARAHWAAQAIRHYELVIERHSSLLDSKAEPITCTQDVEVRDEKVAATIASDCTSQPEFYSPALKGQPTEPTISGLFDQISSDTQAVIWSNEGTGCSYLSVSVAYDTDWGYPHHMEYRWQQPRPEFGYPIDARYFPPGTATPPARCRTDLLADGPVIAITLTALP